MLRWAGMLSPAPTWRSLGMLAVATAIVAIGVLLEGRLRALLVFAGIVALLAMFAFSGVPFSWVRHLRIWATGDGIGQGLSGLPRTLIPYTGLDPWIREVILLGGGLLLLGSALVLALAPRPLSEARRAVSAIPLLTLAVLPSTINRPPGVYVHGLLLFGLLALFVWGERLDQDDGAVVVGVAAIAAAAGMAFAPVLDTHKPWVNYQALTSSLAPGASESFDWSQRYGPLAWPRKGHEVIDIKAAHQDYWKAQNLDVFNGRGWVAGEAAGGNQLVGVDQSSIQTWTQKLTVTLRAMKTTNVIAAGFALQPTHIASAVSTGVSPGTWTTGTQLGPGDSYQVSVYDPHPTSGQLETAGQDYPDTLIGYRAMFLPGDRRRHRGRVPGVRVTWAVADLRRATADSPSALFQALTLRSRICPVTAPGSRVSDALRLRHGRQVVPVARVLLQREHARAPVPARELPVHRQVRLLPAVRRSDGDAAADGRGPGPSLCRLHERLV